MSAEDLASRIFATRNAAHLAHWATSSYAEHAALGALYESLPGTLDAFIETYQGVFGKIGEVPTANVTAPIREHIAAEIKWLAEYGPSCARGVSALQNLLDAITEAHAIAYYKLTNLK